MPFTVRTWPAARSSETSTAVALVSQTARGVPLGRETVSLAPGKPAALQLPSSNQFELTAPVQV